MSRPDGDALQQAQQLLTHRPDLSCLWTVPGAFNNNLMFSARELEQAGTGQASWQRWESWSQVRHPKSLPAAVALWFHPPTLSTGVGS